jgi:hypothetical protein
VPTRAELATALQARVQAGDIVITQGAGDVNQSGVGAARAAQGREGEDSPAAGRPEKDDDEMGFTIEELKRKGIAS